MRFHVTLRDGYRYNALVITETVEAETPAEAIPLALAQARLSRERQTWESGSVTMDDGRYTDCGRIVGHSYPVLATVERAVSPWRHTRSRRFA